MNWTIEKIPELKSYTVEWAEIGNYYLSRSNVVYHSSNLKPPFKKVAAIDAPFWKQTASNLRLAQRLLRFQVTNIIPLGNDEIFVTLGDAVSGANDVVFAHTVGESDARSEQLLAHRDSDIARRIS